MSNSFGKRSVISGSCHTSRPCGALLHEHDLPAVVAQAGEVAVVGPVEELLALARARAGKHVALVVAVEVDLEGLAGGLVAVEQLLLDVRFAGGGDERRHPVLVRGDVVDLGARLDDARPAHHARHAVAALPVGVLLALERRRAAIGPGEDLGAVVGGPDDDGVVGDAEVVELLQQLADHAVEFDHAIGVDAQAGLAFRLRLEMRVDVHARRVEPAEERLRRPCAAGR